MDDSFTEFCFTIQPIRDQLDRGITTFDQLLKAIVHLSTFSRDGYTAAGCFLQSLLVIPDLGEGERRLVADVVATLYSDTLDED